MKKNETLVKGNTTIILIKSKTHGNFEVMIDTEDYEKVENYCWHIDKRTNNFYAKTSVLEKGIYKRKYMHKMIVECSTDKVIDHRNGNTLDNRKCNLKICTQKENSNNQKLSSNNTSGYRNIYFNKKNNTWDVQIKHKRVGQFKNLKDAVKARNIYLIENLADELCLLYDRF